ncbi:MAG: PAS domain S-box protein, partial [Methanomicrobiales archaeon]|nr:PAS domain S-box protein [Methanomicrobiales archaeon]
EVLFEPLGRHFHIAVFSPKKGWFATVFSDITHKKQAEEEQAEIHRTLEEQHTLFSAVINSAASNIFSLDKEFRYIVFNRQHAATMKALFGTEISIGKNILECITIEKDRAAMKKNLTAALAGNTVKDEGYTGDHTLSRQYMEPSFNPIRTSSGEITGVAVISRDGTERKKAEKALRTSEERYRRLTENLQDIIFRISLPSRNFEYVNPAALPITGYTPEEFYADAGIMQKLIHPDFQNNLAHHWERMAKGDILPEYEYMICHKNGTTRWLHQRNTIVRDNTGHVAAVEGVVTDVTDRKNAEIALRQIEERYRIISENTGDVIWLLDPETLKFRFISPSIYRLLGYTPEEILAMSLPQVLTPEGLRYVQESTPRTIRKILNGDESARIQRVYIDNIRKDGSVIPVEIVATLLGGSEPGTFEILGVSRDISEQKKAKDALLESEEKFRTLVETTSDLVWEIDDRGTYTYVSPRVRELLGYEPGELVGKSPFTIMPADEAELMTAEFRRFSVSHQPVPSIINRCIHKDGSIVILETTAVPIFSKDGRFAGYRGVDRDITQRKIAQDALQESEERYRTFVECANEAIFVIQDGKIPFCNKNGLDLIGYDSAWLATHPFLDLVHPDDRKPALDRHLRRLNGESFEPRAELRVIDAQKNLHWLEINAVNVPWDGKTSTLNFATDITERKKADDALRESETSYHGLFNTVKEAIYIQDRDGHFLNVNDGAVEMYGYPREFFIKKTPVVLAAPGYNDLHILQEHFERAFAGEPQYFEFWGKRANGEIFPKDVRLYHGSYFGKDVLIAVATDITDRK